MSVNVAYVGPVNGRLSLSMVLLDNTNGVQAVNVADLPNLDLRQGPSMCLGNENLHIFVTNFGDFSIHEVLYDVIKNEFRHVGQVTGAYTADRTAAVFNSDTQTMHLFYQDRNVLKEAVRVGGQSWYTATVQQAKSCDWGPAACTRGGAINIAYTHNNSLQVGYIQNGVLNDITPNPNVSVWWGPTLVNYYSKLFAIFGWQNTNNLNCIVNSEKTGWSGFNEINSYNCVDQGPSACIFNNEIFCFSQASGNRLLYTIYALGAWPDDNPDRGTNFTAVKFNGNLINNVYFAPAAVAVG